MTDTGQQFMQLVYLFHATTMQALGKIKNPVTDKVERNMAQASESIGMLEMLKEKTKGNLNADENRFLEMTLSELRLNFVDEQQKGVTA